MWHRRSKRLQGAKEEVGSDEGGKKMVRKSRIDDIKLRSLVERGDMTVKEMADELKETPSAVYARLGVLGLQTSRKPGNAGRKIKEKKSRPGKAGLVAVIDPESSLETRIVDAMREWATKNADKLSWLAAEKRIFYTLTGYMPTQILEPYIDKETQELQGRDWYLENGEVKRRR